MRHVWSLLAGIAITPLAWTLIAYGQALTISDAADYPADPSARLLAGGALLVAAGLLAGLIGGLRVSPVGTLVPAIVFIGVSVYSWLSPLQAGLTLNRLHWSVAGVELGLFAPIYTGALPVLGGTLAVCAFSVQRWRSWPRPPVTDTADPDPAAPAALPTSEPDRTAVYSRLRQGPPALPDQEVDTLRDGDPPTTHSPATTLVPATPAAGSGADAPSWPKPTGPQ